jgi:hypothetical protein
VRAVCGKAARPDCAGGGGNSRPYRDRREFITLLGGAAAWPLAARAQQGDRGRRIGVLTLGDENDVWKTYVSAFTQALAGLGWTDGRNVRMDLRWYGDDINRMRAFAQELVGLQPEVILASTTLATVAVQRETRTIPIVFATVADPVVQSCGSTAREGTSPVSATWKPRKGGKWLELLSEIAPGLKRAAIMFNPDAVTVSANMLSFEMAARSLKVAPIIARVHGDAEIETVITALGREPGRRPCRHTGYIHGRASRADHIGGGPKQRTGGLSRILLRQRGRFALLRSEDGGLLYGHSIRDRDSYRNVRVRCSTYGRQSNCWIIRST